MAAPAPLLIRAPLSAADDDDEAATSASSSPPSVSDLGVSPAPRARVAVPAAPRVAPLFAAGDVFYDDATDYEEDDEVETGHGFFRVARVLPAGQDPVNPVLDAAVSSDAPESERFGAGGSSLDVSFGSPMSVLDAFGAGEAAARRGFGDVADGDAGGSSIGILNAFNGGDVDARIDSELVSDGPGVKVTPEEAAGVEAVTDGVSVPLLGGAEEGDGNVGSLGESFGTSMIVLDVVDSGEVGARTNSQCGLDGFEAKDTWGEVGAVEAVTNVVSEPLVESAEKGDCSPVGVTDALEMKDGVFEDDHVELPSAMDAGEEDAGLGSGNGGLEAKDGTTKHEVVMDVDEMFAIMNSGVEDISCDSEMRDTMLELDVQTNDDNPPYVDDRGQNEVGEEINDDTAVSDDPANVTNFDDDNAVELLGKGLEDHVHAPSTKEMHFGFDDSDKEVHDDNEENASEKKIEVYDYATLAELLRAADRLPAEGNVKVFPVESPTSWKPSPPMDNINQINISPPVMAVRADTENEMTDEERKLYRKVDTMRIKYLRLLHKLGYDPGHQVAIQVLHRLSLAEGFRRIRMANQSSELEYAWKSALQLEAQGADDLELSCNILVLGKTGVGKSATINSIFGEDKSKTNAFALETSSVKEIAGVVDDVKLRVIDTPGLGASVMDEKSNRKVLNSVKKYIKRCPPDVVLYVDRIDSQRQNNHNLPVLRCITSALGLQIWSKTVITLTHSAAAPPDGPSGSPVSYEMVVNRQAHALQQSIWQATDDPLIENPVALVENHPSCQRNSEGEKVLPNGLIWRRLLLLLCYSLKIVLEIDSLSKRRLVASASLFGQRFRTPPLPYFLSVLLQSRVHPKLATDQSVEIGDSDVDVDLLLDKNEENDEDDSDLLPPFKPLSKSEVATLSKEEQRSYFDEYDYRFKLFQKKQWKERARRLKEIKKSGGSNHDHLGDNALPDDENDIEKSPMPDWALPASFDSDDPAYRYRCLEPTPPRLLVRAVTNPDGWDHDCGFDGVSIQHSLDVANTFPAYMWVQVNKDKREFTIQLDSSISAKHGENGSTLAGFDIETMTRQLACTLRGEAKFKNLKRNTATGGLSVAFSGDTMATGAKLEDKLSVGRRLTLVGSTGAVSAKHDTAFGVNMEACLLDKDYPIGEAMAALGVSLVRWHKEVTMAANLKSQFSVGRSSNMAVHVDLDNKMTGRVSIKGSTREQLQIALLGICSTVIYLWNRVHAHTH